MKKVACLALFFSVACSSSGPGPIPTPSLHTPRWAFRPWISKDISTTDDSYDYVGGFMSRQIPVGVLVIDSPWPTDYSTFTPNPVRYHDFGKLVSDMKAQDVRMVMWTTAFMNDMSYDAEQGGDSYTAENTDYDVAHKNGYFVDDGLRYDWWKGTGGSLDFFNDDARNWWHGLQDQVLSLGIAGYKLDFGDEYMTSDPTKTAKGTISHQEYSEEYYRDMLAYGVQQRGAEEFTTMVRGYDVSYQWDARFYANKDAAPLVWAGDNRRDWIGLVDVLDESFRSAQAGYVVLGWDDGGYLNVDDKDLAGPGIPFSTDVFERWTAISGIGPFMELHARDNPAPWTFADRPDEATANYKYWASLHEAIAPFHYSLAEEAYAGHRGSIVGPIGDESTWPGDYRYTLGDVILVAPILDATGMRDVVLPEGGWYDWWDGSVANGTVHRDYSADEQKIPLFVKAGSIIPLDGHPAGSGLDATLAGAIGLPSSGGALLVLAAPGPQATTFTLHDVDATATLGISSSPVTLTSNSARPILWRVRQDAAPASVTCGLALPMAASLDALSTTAGWWHDPNAPYTWIRADGDAGGVSCTVQ